MVFHDVVGTVATHVVPVIEGAILVALVVISVRRLADPLARRRVATAGAFA